MKQKIFDKMIEYGWTLEDFEKVYYDHYYNLQDWFDFLVENDYDFTMEDISKSKFTDFVDFMSDFLRALNDLESEEK